MGVAYSVERRLQLAKERGILVDPQDHWLLEEYTWTINEDGYPHTRLPISRVRVFLHHAIMGYPIWEGDEIDHRDRCPVNNQRYNLRYTSRSGQMLNRSWRLGETGARNITLRSNGKYRVLLYRDKTQVYLGQFDTLDEAVAERDEWLDQHKEYVSSTT